MGNIKDLKRMVHGMGKAIRDLDIDDDAFKGIEAVIRSMTPEERKNPQLINGSRRARIANGSGSSVQDINRLLKQFKQTKKMMTAMTGDKNKRRSLGNVFK
jgi:signal recognition particle subunit SRP54